MIKNNSLTIKGDSRIVVQLLPIGDSLRAELFCKPFGKFLHIVSRGKGLKVSRDRERGKSLATRDLDEEKRFKDAVLADVERLSDDYDGDALRVPLTGKLSEPTGNAKTPQRDSFHRMAGRRSLPDKALHHGG
ncbi:MAG: hypothetical protein ACLU4J_22680 [Butyricimonas paravirosa]